MQRPQSFARARRRLWARAGHAARFATTIFVLYKVFESKVYVRTSDSKVYIRTSDSKVYMRTSDSKVYMQTSDSKVYMRTSDSKASETIVKQPFAVVLSLHLSGANNCV